MMPRHHHLTHEARHGDAQRRYRRAAIVAALALALFTVAVFSKENPFDDGYEIRAVFASDNQLKPGSEVRIAGLRVGKVAAIERGPHRTSLVTMDIDGHGRPIHADATLTIEPRLALEGSVYLDLSPGTPAAPELPSGATIARERTAVPVQLDQVLDVFDLPTRGALHRSIRELAKSLGTGSPGPDAGVPSGSRALRGAVRELDGALTSVTQVTRAARGTQPGDLGRALRSSRDVTAQLVENPAALADLATNVNRVTGALAAEDRQLSASVRGMDDVLGVAGPSLTALDAALPVLTEFGEALRPSLREAPAALRTTNRLIGQVDALVRPRELPALLGELAPVTANLPELERRLEGLLPLVTSVNECLSSNVVPTLNEEIEDGPHTTGDPVWLDGMHMFTAFTSAVGQFDGNGTAIRTGAAFGDSTFDGVILGLGRLVGGGPEIQGVRPTWLGYGVEPPYRPDARCTDQSLPVLGKRSGPPPAWPRSGETVQMGRGR